MTAALLARSAALARDIEAWRAEAEANGPMEKHHYQLRELDALIGGPARTLRDTTPPTDAIGTKRLMDDIAKLERVWDVFRGKLLQRSVERYRRQLMLADAFAWCCFRPVAAKAGIAEIGQRGGEPPLVFFEGLETPVALARGRSFARELAHPLDEQDRFADLLRRLPVPLIGLPWNAIAHLPDLMLVAHEVGHVADGDFGISAAMFAAAPAELAVGSPWRPRLAEAVADVYGALAAGPAYVQAMATFLAPWLEAERNGGATDPGYPPAALRLRMMTRAIQAQGLPENLLPGEARESLQQSDADAEAVDRLAAAIAATKLTKLGSASLIEAFATPSNKQNQYFELFGPADLLDQANRDKNRLLAPGALALQSMDVRAMIAAAQLGFMENPAAYSGASVGDRVHTRFTAVQPPGVLSVAAGAPPISTLDVLAMLGDS